ncbi:unnamed protein product [Mytilus edulis]|uniref:Endonuclease/exonuclease/phosphatase domain-containing protein n=1 Tax=Mytilus edulis TaxID=6550 RepID=A0A8S3PYE5_MYTED|nr:unnamed protein product [Mytilus edulis]
MLTQKVDMICEKISNIDKLTEKLNKFDKTVNSMVKSVENINKRVDEVEKGLNFINTEFENNKKDVREVKKNLTEIRSENEEAIETIAKLQKDFDDLNEKQLDLQTRAMRENLVFTGIPMHDKNELSDDTEKIIQNFMTTELKMSTLPEFHRAHRFGKEYTEKHPDGSIKFITKPIVCRFVNYKQRELVRKAARELKDTKYGINEQFPKEINERRKALWPHFQEARRQKKKAFFKRDRLFIDGNEFLPKNNTHVKDTGVMDTDERQTRASHPQKTKVLDQKNSTSRKIHNPVEDPEKARTSDLHSCSLPVNKDIDVHNKTIEILLYPEFKSLLDKHDIVCLTETKLDDVDEIDCDNFIFHYKNRKKLANHKSGGIALGFKKYLDKYIKYIQSDCQFVLWFSIDKKVLDLPKDAIFGIIYIPPINTSYTSEDAFTEIEFELQNFCSKTNYITMLGDFNSRTGNLSDFYNIDKDSSFENNFTDYNELSDVDVLDELGIPRLRNSIDTVVNGYGRKFIDFCKNNRMFILNGRLEENKTGSPTSRNSSVIDYALSSTHFLYNICKLEVLNFCKLFSDVHSPLSLQLYTNNEINDKLLTETFCCGDERVNKWKNEKCNEYKNNIDRNKVDDICNRLSAYVNDVNNVTKYDMNNIVTDICDTLTESAKKTKKTNKSPV